MKATILAGLSALTASVAAVSNSVPIDPIYGLGQHFFYTTNGSQFFMRGVAYQQDAGANGTTSSGIGSGQYSDPLADEAACNRDIPYLAQLRTNTIRVYAIDPTKNHDACMNALARAGIYVVSDLSSPGESIESNNPAWNVDLLTRYTAVIDALAPYNNTLGFFAGNEVDSQLNQTAANAFVKAAVRDTKNYIRTKGYRTGLGVGYATADVPGRDNIADFYACGDDSTSIDFWGYNVYSWCGNSSYTDSQYDQRVDFFRNYPKPAFFAEYGCNQVPGGAAGRPFSEVPVLFGEQMTPVFSGGIVYMYFQTSNDFGLVSVGGDGNVTPLADFYSLSRQIATVSPSSTQAASYKPSNTAPACPSVVTAGDNEWLAVASPLPPSPNPALCSCGVNSFSCVATSNNETAYADIFNYICGAYPAGCNGLAANATTGSYGSYKPCEAKQQLAFAMNQYYLHNGRSASACDFGGAATTQAPATAATCASLLNAVGPSGTGSAPFPTGGQLSTSKGSGARSVSAPFIFSMGSPLLAAYSTLAFVSVVALAIL